MKILYASVHSILEYDELSLFTELGHDCFSLGAYVKPEGHHLLPRPGIPNMKPHPELERFAIEYPKTHIADELIEWADVIFIMHDPNVIEQNWERIKHKKVIWRSIGQSTSGVENMIRRMRYDGMKIVRMSPREENIVGYLGTDDIIRFYKDPEVWHDWNGDTKRVVNFTQTLKGRRTFCHHDQIMQLINGFPSLIYGSGNEDLGGLNGGELPYELQKGAMRDNRVFVYGGTFPSPYTLSLEEAMMTGMPVVALGSHLAQDIEVAPQDKYDYYELGDFMINGQNGFISDDINKLREYIHELLENQELARKISEEGRKTAIQFFGKEEIKDKWHQFFYKLEKGDL